MAKVAEKAWLWPCLLGFTRPHFPGKPGQKPGKPGLASLCQASRVFGRAPNAREVCCKLLSLFSNKDLARILNYFSITQSVKRPRSTKTSIHNQSGLSKQFIAQSEMEMTEIIFTKKAFHKTLV